MYYCSICEKNHSKEEYHSEYFIYKCMIDFNSHIKKKTQTPILCNDPLMILYNICGSDFYHICYDPNWNAYDVILTPQALKLYCRYHPFNAIEYLKLHDADDENDEYVIECIKSDPSCFSKLPEKYSTPKFWLLFVEMCLLKKYEIGAIYSVYLQCSINSHFKFM